jgi:hypothetical protein
VRAAFRFRDKIRNRPALAMLLFYQRPVALNRQAHRDFRIRRSVARYEFAAATNSLPVVGAEFARAALEYPVVFAGTIAAQALPAVLVGLRDAQNLFVDAEGHWRDGCYVPAFARRYPFVLAQADTAAAQPYTVCVDEAFDGIGPGQDGEALFDEQGEPARFLREALDFLRGYQQQLQATHDFVQALAERELLVQRSLHVTTASGEALRLDGFLVVDEQRLQGLDDATVGAWLRNGYLAWIHAHLMSLGQTSALLRRLPRHRELAN